MSTLTSDDMREALGKIGKEQEQHWRSMAPQLAGMRILESKDLGGSAMVLMVSPRAYRVIKDEIARLDRENFSLIGGDCMSDLKLLNLHMEKRTEELSVRTVKGSDWVTISINDDDDGGCVRGVTLFGYEDLSDLHYMLGRVLDKCAEGE